MDNLKSGGTISSDITLPVMLFETLIDHLGKFSVGLNFYMINYVMYTFSKIVTPDFQSKVAPSDGSRLPNLIYIHTYQSVFFLLPYYSNFSFHMRPLGIRGRAEMKCLEPLDCHKILPQQYDNV